MTKLRLNKNDVMAAARACGSSLLDQIDYAILERIGKTNVIPLTDASIKDG